jgi:hypothetical protein
MGIVRYVWRKGRSYGMKRSIWCLGAGILTLAIAGAARADWNPNDPAKWVQLPDLVNGMDVEAVAPGTLADDWECVAVEPITDVHIWGSWLNNIRPDPLAMNQVVFRLGIWADVPVGPNNTFSHPGLELWHTVTTPTASRIYAAPVSEQFVTPGPPMGVMGFDNEVWQYNFLNLKNEIGETFVQQGTSSTPMVYWLSVQMVNSPVGIFGWKTAIPPHRIDDAVSRINDGAPWGDLHYLPNGPYGTESLDLAFVITTPEPASLCALGLGGLLLLVRRRRA